AQFRTGLQPGAGAISCGAVSTKRPAGARRREALGIDVRGVGADGRRGHAMTRVSEIPETKPSWGLAALDEVRTARRQHQDSTATERGRWLDSNWYFYGRVKQLLQFIVEPGSRVLELRCLRGDTLAELQASRGVGVEIGEKFDYVIFNHIFDTVDILKALERIKAHSTAETCLVVVNYNHLWQPIL